MQINDWALGAVLLLESLSPAKFCSPGSCTALAGHAGNLHLKIIIQRVIDQTSTTCSWRSFLKYKFSVPSFSGSMAFSMRSSKKCVQWKYFNSDSNLFTIAQQLSLNQISHQMWGLWFTSCSPGTGATGCWNSLQLAILSSSEPVCGLTSTLLYYYTQHNDFSQNWQVPPPVAISCWQILNPNMTILLLVSSSVLEHSGLESGQGPEHTHTSWPCTVAEIIAFA